MRMCALRVRLAWKSVLSAHCKSTGLKGERMSETVHIAGMLIHTRLDAIDSAMHAIRHSRNTEVHLTGVPGKFIAVIECAHERELARIIEEMQSHPGVISVSMTSHYIEDMVALAAEMPE